MVNRENLKQKYGEERVLVVPRAVLTKLNLDKEGYNSMSEAEMQSVIKHLEESSYYIPRWTSDGNPDEVELIAYITFGDPKNFMFTYKRIKNGDARGDGALSVGVGGHINPCDNGSINGIIYESAEREISEELGFQVAVEDFQPKGFIRCTKTEYDQDHLGIHLNILAGVYNVAEKDKMLPLGIMNTKTLKELFYNELENWTKIIVDEALEVEKDE